MGRWQNFASSRPFTDLGRISLAHLTSPRETSHVCRCCSCLYTLLCSVSFRFALTNKNGGGFALQYSVSLQSEEEVQQQYQRRPGQAVSVTGHGRHLESCLHTASSHFSLPVPLNVTPGFSTDIGQSPEGWNVSVYDPITIWLPENSTSLQWS